MNTFENFSCILKLPINECLFLLYREPNFPEALRAHKDPSKHEIILNKSEADKCVKTAMGDFIKCCSMSISMSSPVKHKATKRKMSMNEKEEKDPNESIEHKDESQGNIFLLKLFCLCC